MYLEMGQQRLIQGVSGSLGNPQVDVVQLEPLQAVVKGRRDVVDASLKDGVEDLGSDE